MMRALQMYQQAEGFLLDSHADSEVVLKEMKVAMKQAPKQQRPRLQEHVETMDAFRDHQDEKIKEVQAQIVRIDEKLAEAMGGLVEAMGGVNEANEAIEKFAQQQQ